MIAAVLVVMTLADGQSSAQDAPVFPFGSGGVITTGAGAADGPFAAAPGGGDASPAAALAELRERALAAGWSSSQFQSFSDLVRRLDAQELPHEPVVDRALQGIVKGADYNRIDTVCQGLIDRIRRGADLVDGRFPRNQEPKPPIEAPGRGRVVFHERLELIDRTAFALEKGVPAASLAELFSQIPVSGEPPAQIAAMNAPVMTVTSLTADGIPASESVQFVRDVWKMGVRGRDLEGLAVALNAGGNPEVLTWVRESLRDGIPPGQVIQELRHGDRRRGAPPGNIGRPGRRPGNRDGNGPPTDPGRRGRGRKDGGRGRP